MTEAFGLHKIGQIALTVRNLEAATTFYRDTLGMKHLFSVPNLAFFDCDGVRLMLGLPEENATGASDSILYFSVPDIHVAYETLHLRNVPFVDAPHVVANMETYDLWMVFFRDPDAHLIGMMSEVPRA